MTAPSAIVLVLDQLSASMLGPYGNTSVETANFNRLAAESVLFEFAFASSPKLTTAYDHWWGPKPLLPAIESSDLHDPAESSVSLTFPTRLSEAGIETVLITDDLSISEHRSAEFERVIYLESLVATASTKAAENEAETGLAQFFAAATAWINEEFEPGMLVWLHSQGLSGPWDAPFAWREELCDEEDPLPPDFVAAPSLWLDPDTTDPDELLGLQIAATAQVRLLDEFLGVLLDEIDRLPADCQPMFCLTSPRGCALGEHGLVGAGAQLFNESVQIPLIIRPAQCPLTHQATRSSKLVQTKQLIPLLEQALIANSPVAAESQTPVNPSSLATQELLSELNQVLPNREWESIVISSDEHESLQTHAWKLLRSKMGGAQLFAKPDDRFEVNDVSSRCPDVVEKMIVLLEERLQGKQFKLPEELVRRAD